MFIRLTLAALFLSSAAMAAEPLRVIDGDGLELRGKKIRLWGIDAPELRQECSKDGKRYPCGRVAKDALSAFVGAAQLVCEELDTDRYGRMIAKCEVAGEDLAALMVRSGWAVDWPLYSKGAYADEQAVAESGNLGQWAGFFVAPWEWRKGQ